MKEQLPVVGCQLPEQQEQARLNQQAADYREALLQEANAGVLGNTWPRAIPVTERMPAQPDADCVDTYLGFVPDLDGWNVLFWDGRGFKLIDDEFEEYMDDVTYWLHMPPDPPEVTR